ncbi:MAG: hypothetical protein ISN28_14135 [Ectothiorhodospiraceae bacterium AqS1]|nr:hypothetical protein [Ectothiorhodospiraceae bacterium AqS1]
MDVSWLQTILTIVSIIVAILIPGVLRAPRIERALGRVEGTSNRIDNRLDRMDNRIPASRNP